MNRIVTTHVYPPVPFRNSDWQAMYADDEPEPGVRVGRGATEDEAIADLLSQEPEA